MSEIADSAAKIASNGDIQVIPLLLTIAASFPSSATFGNFFVSGNNQFCNLQYYMSEKTDRSPFSVGLKKGQGKSGSPLLFITTRPFLTDPDITGTAMISLVVGQKIVFQHRQTLSAQDDPMTAYVPLNIMLDWLKNGKSYILTTSIGKSTVDPNGYSHKFDFFDGPAAASYLASCASQ